MRGGLIAVLVVLLAAAAVPVGSRAGAPRAVAAAAPRILFGLGPEADGARAGNLAGAAPLGVLSSWYNGPSDLGWMTGWKKTEVAHDYAAGYAMHLIVWSGGSQTKVPTRYGPACGQAYPLSAQFRRDMAALARTFAPPAGHRFYVTLFTEFQTYACHGNEWSAEGATTAYFKALKDQYRAALATFHRLAPGSAVSLGWGGWQARWDNPRVGGGRSLFKHFADVMRLSDFESFEVINSGSAASDITGMTQALGQFGPVMLAYFRPKEDSTQLSVLQTVLARSFLQQLSSSRLFAIGFMDERFMSSEPQSFLVVRDAIRQFGCSSCGP